MVKRAVRNSIRQELVRQDKIVRAALVKELTQTSFALAAGLTASVQGWKKKPKFKPVIEIKPKLLRADVNIEGSKELVNIFHYVDKGTGKFGPKKSSYIIQPKVEGGMLRFRTGYKPRTKAIAKANVGPGKATGPFRSAKEVVHPGIKGRKFTETIEDVLSPDFKRRMENTLLRASRKIKR